MQREQHQSSLITDKNSRMIRLLHILVIALGGILYFASALIDGVWFDEAYTVAAINNSFSDMLYYLTFDVHPHLYYFFLKLWSFVFGNGIIALRLFSAVFAFLTALLGYTHIKKDFGDRVGFFFSFLTVFSFPMLKYALQIRMYTLAIFLLTLTAIYCQRYINTASKKDRILYILFSILSAYMHYFAFFLVAMISAFMLVRAIIKKEFSRWIFDSIAQLFGYSVGISVFIFQISLDGANWIRVFYPEVLFDTATHPFIGNPLSFYFEKTSLIYILLGSVTVLIACAIFGALIYKFKTKKNEYLVPFMSFSLVLAVLGFVLAVSIFRPIYHQRYSVLFTGFIAFSVAFLLAKLNLQAIKAIIAITLVVCFLVVALPFWEENYDIKNKTYTDIIEVREGDVLVTDDFHSFVYTIKLPKNDIVFYNPFSWPIERNFAIFGDNVSIDTDISDFANYNGRIWVSGKESISFFDSLENASVIEEKQYFPNYYDEHNNYQKYILTFKLYEIKAD